MIPQFSEPSTTFFHAEVVLKAEVSAGEITKIAAVQLDASVGGGSAISLQADKVSFDTKLMSVSNNVLIGQDLNAEKADDHQVLIGMANSTTPFVHVRQDAENFVEMVGRPPASSDPFFQVVANDTQIMAVTKDGVSFLVAPSVSSLRSLQIRDTSGNLVGYYGGDDGSLQMNTVSNNRINIFGSNDITVQTGNGDVLLNADDDVDISAATGDVRINSILGDVIFETLPTSDPGVAGALWRSGNDPKISTG